MKSSVVTTAALIGAGALAGCITDGGSGELIGDERPEVLTRREFAILSAISDQVIAQMDGTPSARETRTARRIDRELTFSDGLLTADVRAALSVIEYGPFLDLHLGRFTRLSAPDRDAYLRACATSKWKLRRNAYNGLRFLCLFFYYSDARTWRSIGYNGPQVDRKLPEASNALESLDQAVRSART